MSTDQVGWRSRLWATALTTLVAGALSFAAHAGGPAAAHLVRVFPDHYLAGGQRLTSVDKLDDWVRSQGARSVEFHSCMWSAGERLAAAIEKLQYVYIDVRWTPAGKSGCPAVANEKAAQAH